jgi:hypothetical protein
MSLVVLFCFTIKRLESVPGRFFIMVILRFQTVSLHCFVITVISGPLDRLCGLVVRVPGYTAEMYRASCGVRLYMLCRRYVARPQSKFPTRPTGSKPYIARSDCAYVIEQCCSMAHALTILPAFSQ